VTGKAFVTGVTGQDGSYLAERLLADGWEVAGLVRSAEETVVDGVRTIVGDLSDTDVFHRSLDSLRPDVVFHLAGMSSVAASWSEPALCVELVGAATARLLEAALPPGTAAGEGPRVVLASSAEVFGGAASSPQDESTPVRPASPYGAAKALVLQLGQVYRSAGHHVSSAVLFNHESPRRPASFVTRKITSGAADVARGRSQELRLGNLAAVRDWGWAPDYVDALVRMSATEQSEDYVVATGVPHTVEDFVAAAFAAAGVEDWRRYVVVDPRFFRPVDGVALVGDPSRIGRELGWTPTVPFEQVVARMVEADLRDGT
jgi:GDPmannose 4,6-dehydratase